MKRSKKWRWLTGTTAACVLVGALGIGGTIAYMTDNESVTNTFTVGKIDVDLTEPNYPGNDSPDVKDLVPNQEVQKDPKVTNVGVNDAIVFMSVEVPVKDVTLVKSDGTKGAKEKTELFWLKDASDTQGTFANHFSDQWLELTAKGEKDMAAGDTNTYVFAYKNAVAKDTTTDSLFDKVQLKNVIEGEVTVGEAQNVVVNTYAIQASEVLEGNTDLTDALTEENLGKIYDIYFNQNSEKSSDSEAEPEVTENAAILVDGTSFNTAMKTLAGGLSNVQGIKNKDVVPEDANTLVVSSPESEKEILMYFYDGYIYVSTEAEKVYLNPDSSSMFADCKSLHDVYFMLNWDTGRVTDMSKMFYNCKQFSKASALSRWDVSNVTNMRSMFYGCTFFNEGVLSEWDVSNVTDMRSMFYSCEHFDRLNNLANWDVSSVTDMSYMFEYCKRINNVDSLSNWDVSNVTDMKEMFCGDKKLISITGLSNWDVSNVTDMKGMFFACVEIANVDSLSNWDVSNVTDMGDMFRDCHALANIDGLSEWDVGNVTKMTYMFSSCPVLENVDSLSNWDVSSVTDIRGLFHTCDALVNVDGLSDWNVGNVTNMSYMFTSNEAFVNVDGLSNWDVSNVTDMENMFRACNALTNIDGLSEWDVGNVTNMSTMFCDCSQLRNSTAINDWNISNVTSFNYMFSNAPSHPKFTKRPGTWRGGTFVPSN